MLLRFINNHFFQCNQFIILSGIPDALKKRIQWVCTDMYEGYINASQEVFGKHTRVVIDRFHVAKRFENMANYFVSHQSSGFVEGLNNKIKVLKRRCYGIFRLDHLFQRITLDIQGYTMLG